MKRIFAIAAALMLCSVASAQNRWAIQPDGKTIRMEVSKATIPHSDHIEMSGKMMATVLYWGVDEQARFTVDRSLVFPMLRTVPNNTHASLMIRQGLDVVSQLRINNNNRLFFRTKYVELNGLMRVVEEHKSGTYGLEVERTIFPTMEQQMMCEHYILRNTGTIAYALQIPDLQQEITTDPKRGVKGSYKVLSQVKGGGVYELQPGQSVECDLVIEALNNEQQSVANLDVKQLLAEREAYISYIDNNLVLDTPDDVIDTEFRYAKIRSSESICKTKGGYMHAPGGESYYAAIWANDQAEYVNPFFPFLGYDVGNESAINSYRHFARFMNDEWKPIPSSIIAEGDDIWNGAGDRGDGAMIAYGAARYALTRSDKREAEELWPLIEWCLEYCKRQINDKGVVKSDKDELEGRFPSGDANLCTSSLYYDALLSASYLCKELGKNGASSYMKQASTLRKNMESYFGANVEGFETYAYYKGNDILRSWICMPLTVGIDERAEGTIQALFSPRLWTKDGLLTQAGSETFWDRSTLYALRGVYAVGATEKATEFMKKYSATRLLGDHVPYAIEAWPEGNQRHLSAESGLYARIITEGMFGIRPTGFKGFTLTPRLPQEWNFMNLRRIHAFDTCFDIEVNRLAGGKLEVILTYGAKSKKYTIKDGQTLKIRL